ncbi:ketosamine-3-kinase-like isoform X1 [Lytechinus variegatus]|uniref:ketosamine-3-kinase-like isoform X1 n=2 Tax=Lytechinus variegatus TaxID=7654 RepID=UPI001BB1CAA8|nr:ketosamine-3-kinase-like isoform X1 [Lytechinus variegatus]
MTVLRILIFSKMEEALYDLTGLKTLEEIPSLMTLGQGFISECRSFQSEKGKFFVKMNTKSQARTMFEGEKAGLSAILATGLVRCPIPIEIYDLKDGPGSIFVMEYMELRDLDRYAATLGEAIARLHLHNSRLKMKEEKHEGRIGGVPVSRPTYMQDVNGEDVEEETQRSVSQFGFHTTTCGGYQPLDNTWSDDWMNFYVRQRLKPKVDNIEREYGDRTLIELWPRLLAVIPSLYRGIDRIVPALLHGDLHGGNVAETTTGPVTYDPACFYGHHELDLAETRDFVDFNQDFYPAYYRLVPKAEGFDEREKLYKIFHYLNNWSHFGPKYKDKVITLIGELVEK